MSAVLEAKDAIRELMAAYAQALDACRFADVAACFAADGEWTTDYGAARGPAEIEKFIAGIVPVKGEGPQRKHYITNIIIAVDGDSASAVSDYLVVRESENGLLPVIVDRATHQVLLESPGMRVSIDLEERTLAFGDARVSFEIDPFSRRCLLQGVDELGFLLAQEPAIAAWEGKGDGCAP